MPFRAAEGVGKGGEGGERGRHATQINLSLVAFSIFYFLKHSTASVGKRCYRPVHSSSVHKCGGKKKDRREDTAHKMCEQVNTHALVKTLNIPFWQ